MADNRPLLPARCGLCVYYPHGGLCHRHAPSPGDEPFEVALWPKVPATARCGSGAAISDDGPNLVTCASCVHWEHPPGGIKPFQRSGRSVDYWANTGMCVNFAPSPSAERDREVYWKVVHASDSCGDGMTPEPAEE